MNDNVLADFGQAIRKIRTNAGISQEAFASKCELHRTYISDIELGKRNVSLENIQKMAIFGPCSVKISTIPKFPPPVLYLTKPDSAEIWRFWTIFSSAGM